jgi:uncharacterized membrane protein YphA (DoxX/SURF4 family)
MIVNPFPHLLDYSVFAPTIIRIALACLFATTAVRFFRMRRQLAHAPLPLIGTPGSTIVWLFIVVCGAVAVALFLGYYTQVAALIAAIGMLKHALIAKRYPMFSPYSRATCLLAFVMCLSLLLTGAGTLAFDVRL